MFENNSLYKHSQSLTQHTTFTQDNCHSVTHVSENYDIWYDDDDNDGEDDNDYDD